eukprot:symbB.v1.2.005512.t1/scaffold310.1/size231343/17
MLILRLVRADDGSDAYADERKQESMTVLRVITISFLAARVLPGKRLQFSPLFWMLQNMLPAQMAPGAHPPAGPAPPGGPTQPLTMVAPSTAFSGEAGRYPWFRVSFVGGVDLRHGPSVEAPVAAVNIVFPVLCS